MNVKWIRYLKIKIATHVFWEHSYEKISSQHTVCGQHEKVILSDEIRGYDRCLKRCKYSLYKALRKWDFVSTTNCVEEVPLQNSRESGTTLSPKRINMSVSISDMDIKCSHKMTEAVLSFNGFSVIYCSMNYMYMEDQRHVKIDRFVFKSQLICTTTNDRPVLDIHKLYLFASWLLPDFAL